MNGLIGLEQHKIYCIIGVYPEERNHEQEIYVDLKVETDFSRCIISDHIEDTINYVLLADICTALAQTKKFQLLETYAFAVLEKLLNDFAINWAWIKVSKPMAIKSVKCTTVELKRCKKG
jgi:dihydroneopterin aldolase